MAVKKRATLMAQLAVLVWLWISLGLSVVTCQNVAKLDCPRYVLEHHDLSCVCQPPAGGTGTATWPGHSDNGTLTVPQVRRAQNGTQYHCEVKGQQAGQTWSATYTLLVAYGPSQQEFRISGQQPFPTNGNQTLTLTCEVGEVYPAPDFTWRDVDCDGSETDPTCDVTPRPPDYDQKVVLCEVSRNYKTHLPRNLMTKEYEVQLAYPPLTPPVITVQATQPPLLVKGDNLTCTISGGKPGVDKVVFSCSDPDHGDQQDEGVVGDLSSTVTVTSVSQSQRPMFCECRGVWNVKPEYYSATAEGYYHVEHPAVVTDLNINGCTDCEVTLTGGANHTALLLCSTFGRPAPSKGHFSKEADPSFDASRHRRHKKTVDWSTNFTLEIDKVACQDMGRYTCTADNGVGDRGLASVQLNVQCAPWKAPEEMMNMTEAGTWFQLNAFPVPDRFTYYYLGNRSLQDNGSLVDPENFVTVCKQDDVILYQVSCHAVPTRVPTDMLGDYRVSVGNSLGEVDLFFFILMTVSPEGSSGGVSGGVIAGSVVGVLLAVAVALLAFCLYRRYWKKTAPTKTVDTIEGSPDEHAAPLHTVMTPMGPLKKPKWEERPVDVPDISNNNDNGQIRTVCTPRHRGPTSTPIKGSTMTESDLGYSARLQALLPKKSMEDSGYGEVADLVKPPPPEAVVDADHAYASAEEVIVVEAVLTGVVHAGHLTEESAVCDSGSDHDPDDLHPSPHTGVVPQGGGEYAILEEVGPQRTPDRAAQKEVLAAVSSAGVPQADGDYAILEELSPQRAAAGRVPQEAPYAVSPSLDTQAGSGEGQQQSDYHPIYSQVRVTMTGQGNSILTTSPGSDKSTGTGKKKKSVRMALEPEIVTSESEYDVLCRQGQSVPVSAEDDTYNHIGNFAFTPN